MQGGKADADYLRATYEARFSDRELRNKQVLWSALCESESQQYVPEEGTVLDLGAGYCEFVNAIQAARRIAVDLNPDTAGFAAEGVEVITTSSDDMALVRDGSVDTVFTSNFFEHLPDTAALLPGVCWGYLDHHLALTQYSLSEALSRCGSEVARVLARFLGTAWGGSRLPVTKFTLRTLLTYKSAWLVLVRRGSPWLQQVT